MTTYYFWQLQTKGSFLHNPVVAFLLGFCSIGQSRLLPPSSFFVVAPLPLQKSGIAGVADAAGPPPPLRGLEGPGLIDDADRPD